MPLRIVKFLLCTLVFQFHLMVYAATVTQLKGSKVLIDNGNDDIEVGQEFYIVGSNKKNTGSILKITSVRGDKSVAMIVRGNASAGQSLKLKPLTKSTAKKPTPEDENDLITDTPPATVYRYHSKKIGLLLNVMTNTMTAKESDGVSPTPNIEDVTMTGSSVGITATMDYPYNNWFEFRGTAGYEPFIVAGTAKINGCSNTTSKDCNASIGYLVGGGYARMNFFKNRFLIWAGLGMSGRFPISKTSTAIKTADLKLTSSYAIALGTDYFIDFKTFIPVSIEQQFLQSSSTVSGSLLSFRVGYGLAY